MTAGPLVQLVADYGPADPAYTELIERIALVAPDSDVCLTQVGTSDTLEGGLCVARLAYAEGPPGRVVLHDVGTPPGVRLCVGRTSAGAVVLGANAGFSWSFLADELTRRAEPCYLELSPSPRGRCGHLLCAALVRVLRGHPHAILEPVPRADIPPVPDALRVTPPSRRLLAPPPPRPGSAS